MLLHSPDAYMQFTRDATTCQQRCCGPPTPYQTGQGCLWSAGASAPALSSRQLGDAALEGRLARAAKDFQLGCRIQTVLLLACGCNATENLMRPKLPAAGAPALPPEWRNRLSRQAARQRSCAAPERASSCPRTLAAAGVPRTNCCVNAARELSAQRQKIRCAMDRRALAFRRYRCWTCR